MEISVKQAGTQFFKFEFVLKRQEYAIIEKMHGKMTIFIKFGKEIFISFYDSSQHDAYNFYFLKKDTVGFFQT